MDHDNETIARQFFDALSASRLPDDLLADDMRAWTATAGEWTEKARYQGGIELLANAFDGGIRYSVQSLTVQDDRVAAEVRSEGTLVNGEDFANDYLFLLRIKSGRVASVREFFGARPMQEKLMPVLQDIMAKQAQ